MNAHPVARISAGARSVLVLALAFALFGASPAQARNSYVEPVTWYVATTGADTNSCTAIGAPCKTINGAIGKAAAGDTVKVAIGTYIGSGYRVVEVDKDITLSGGWDVIFSAQTGRSIVDGENARGGVVIYPGNTAAIDHFAIQHGSTGASGGGIDNAGSVLTLTSSIVSSNSAGMDGGGISNRGTLSLTGSVVNNNSGWMGGGIYTSGTLTVNHATIANNTSVDDFWSAQGGGGGIMSASGSVTLNNTAVVGNVLLGDAEGSGIATSADSFTINNSTISGNTGAQAIDNSGNLTLNNSTIAGNESGIDIGSGTATLRNSILAGNATFDCYGLITSAGYNLIGRTTPGCSLTEAIGDKVGTEASPIDPLLSPLANHGGPTFTHALYGGSPALNAGNPAVPGSDENACLTTDQRGAARPVAETCDMGAYEGYVTRVVSILRLDPNPTSASTIHFQVAFSEAVTGVDLTAPFDDFSLTKTGIAGASITAVSGSGSLYTVTVNTGSNNGTLRLNVVDNDSILDVSSTPLGGLGAGNGNYTAGQAYTIKKIPTAISPGKISDWDQTPTYKWLKVPGATQYTLQVWKGTTLLYSRVVLSSACGATTCQNTPAKFLPPGAYKWRVRAMSYGTWKPFSPFKAFTVLGARPGYWKGYGVDLYVTPDRRSVNNYSIYVYIPGCGNYRITHTAPVPIINGKFKFTGPFYANGTFSWPESVGGLTGLKSFFIPGCGYRSSGPYDWMATWRGSSQPDPAIAVPPLLLLPEFDAPLLGPFTVDPLP